MALIEDHFEHHAIIRHHSQAAALMLAGPDGWALPSTTSDNQHPAAVEHLQRALRQQLGIDASVLRCVSATVDEPNNRAALVYELEHHNHDWIQTSGACWMRAGELETERWAHPTQRGLVLEVLRSPPAPVVDGRDWRVPGWWDQAVGWIARELRRLGHTRTAEIEQVRTWEFSCVLRVPTDRGVLYFKAVPHSLAHEIPLTTRLAAAHPQWIASPLAADGERRWLLMRGCGGHALDQIDDISVWQHAAAAYAQLQIDWSHRVGELLALGCPDRRLETLDAAIEPMLADSTAMLPGQPEGLSEAQIAMVRARRRSFTSLAQELATCRIPPSIEHGDFWTSNVLADGAGNGLGCAFIDWTDACVSHPFFSLLPLLHGIAWNAHLAGVPGAAAQVRDAYLEPWTRHESRSGLLHAFELSQTLAALHYAASYWRLLPQVGMQWWLPRMVPFFLKGLLP